MNTQKKKRRSLRPRLSTVNPPLPSMSRIRSRSLPSPRDSTNVVQQFLNPDAEAGWQDTVDKFTGLILQWAEGKLGDENDGTQRETTLPATSPERFSAEDIERRAEAEMDADERERELAWDYLMSRALETMPEADRREWLAERRREEEWQRLRRREMGPGVRRDPLDESWVDWSMTSGEYIE